MRVSCRRAGIGVSREARDGEILPLLPVLFCPAMPKSPMDTSTIIMLCIGGAILLAVTVLMVVVTCLYRKLSNALK